MKAAEALIADKWKAYLATTLIDAEKAEIAKLEPLMKAGDAATAKAQALLTANDSAGIAQFAAQELYPAIDPISEHFGNLIEIQLTAAKASYDDTVNSYQRARWLSIIILIIGAAAALGVAAMVIQKTVLGPLNNANQLASSVANGDLTFTINQQRNDEIGQLLGSLGNMQQQLRELVAGIQSNAASLNQASNELSRTTRQISQAIDDQSESSSSMAAAVEELTVSIRQVADNANHGYELAEHSGNTAHEGGVVIQKMTQDINTIAASMSDTASTVSELGRMSGEINAIVGVIREIAEQTNLLALNAAIEAARAGEQGRGFAVVADEVRKLAERTGKSTAEISVIVERVGSQTRLAVAGMEAQVQQVVSSNQLAEKAGEAIGGIQQESRQVVSSVGDISVALKEQSEASNLLAQHVERIALMSQTNSQAVQEAARTAAFVSQLSDNLLNTTQRFRTA